MGTQIPDDLIYFPNISFHWLTDYCCFPKYVLKGQALNHPTEVLVQVNNL